MIESRVAVLLAERKMNRVQLSKKTKISLNRLKPIYDGTLKGIRIDTLDKLCKALEVKVGDILIYTTED